MNGLHDLGGMDGFGAIERETDEPVFHEQWEGRVFGIGMLGAGLPPTSVDAFRHRIERIGPARYLGSSYYERWLAAVQDALIENRTLNVEEIEARIEQLAEEPDKPLLRREDPSHAEGIARIFRTGNPATRTIRKKPPFAVGDKIVTRNLNPHGHTRLPRYARGKRGTVLLHHGAHVFPDTNAHGLGENPQHLYAVRFSAQELWGNSAEPNQSVLIDLWEAYLEKDKAVRPSSQKNRNKPDTRPSTREKSVQFVKSAKASAKGAVPTAHKRQRGSQKPLTASKAASTRSKTAPPKRKHQ